MSGATPPTLLDWDPRAWRRRKRARAGVVLGLTLLVALILVAVGWYVTNTVDVTAVDWGPAVPDPGPGCSGLGLSTPESATGGTWLVGRSITLTAVLHNIDPGLHCRISNITAALAGGVNVPIAPSGQPGGWSVDSTNAPLSIPPLASSTLSVTVTVADSTSSGPLEIAYYGTATSD